MKYKTLAALMVAALSLSACDDTTDSIGGSITDKVDMLTVTDSSFTATTQTVMADSVYSRSFSPYLGRVVDPETNALVTGNAMMQFQTFANPGFIAENKLKTTDSYGRKVPAATYLQLYFTTFYGDSTAPQKLRVYELDKPMPETTKYYSNFDPIEKGYVRTGGYTVDHNFTIQDLSLSDSVRNSNGETHAISIPLNKAYTAKDGTKYSSFGSYLMTMYRKHPEYYANQNKFLKNVLPGFYVKTIGGSGAMVKIMAGWINMIQVKDSLVKVYDSTAKDSVWETQQFSTSAYVSLTPEVLQTNVITNGSELKDIAADNSCSYLKTPAGLFTEVTLPVEEIFNGHETDSINSVKLTLPCLNSTRANRYSPYTLPKANYLLILPVSKLKSFFENNELPDGDLSHTTNYSSSTNGYTFYNISGLVKYMHHHKGETDWNKAIIVPVTVSTTTTSSGTTVINKVTNDMSLTSTRLQGGTTPLKVTAVYSHFAK
ncbi:DUF4270 domain-containing protein [Prevotella sp. AGR2160]|uniref:DUF4270 domain-containing protein n=1 Tax=Prevotella sp. AGR2160 TaxID=1280674 RepID=UPI000428026E|nr:DUF4270 domain-containing protein [Prevotella sp. AGR2160]